MARPESMHRVSDTGSKDVTLTPTWYVTFEPHKRGAFPKPRSPRETRTFSTEAEAKTFARTKLDEGLTVFAGTINPCLPGRLIRRCPGRRFRRTAASAGLPVRLERTKRQDSTSPTSRLLNSHRSRSAYAASIALACCHSVTGRRGDTQYLEVARAKSA